MHLRRERISRQGWRFEGQHHFGRRIFLLVMTLYLLHGLGWTVLSAWLTDGLVVDGWQQFLLYSLGFFMLAMCGVFITTLSSSIFMKQLGFAVMGFGLGYSTGVTLSYHTAEDIVLALIVTTGLVAIIGFLGCLVHPVLVESLWPFLMLGLLLIIFGFMITPQLVILGADLTQVMHGWSLAIIVVFSGWIVYDMNRAMRMDRTHANASDAAVDIYLDFLNMFLAVLDLIGDGTKEVTSPFRNGEQGSGGSDVDDDGVIMSLIKGVGHVFGAIFSTIFEIIGAIFVGIFEVIAYLVVGFFRLLGAIGKGFLSLFE